jgi:hypothetical protein
VRFLLGMIAGLTKYCRHFRKNLTITLFNLVLIIPFAKNMLKKKEDELREDFKLKVKAMRKNQVYQLP